MLAQRIIEGKLTARHCNCTLCGSTLKRGRSGCKTGVKCYEFSLGLPAGSYLSGGRTLKANERTEMKEIHQKAASTAGGVDGIGGKTFRFVVKGHRPKLCLYL